MKKLFILFALMLCAASFVTAQKMDQKMPQKMDAKMMMQGAKESDEQYLTRFETEAAAALVAGDPSFLEKFVPEDGVVTDPSGMMIGKSDLIALVRSGALHFETSKFSEIKVRLYNNGSTAIVTYLSEDKGMIKYPDGKTQDISGKYRWTDTFVKMKGTWMCVATHGTPIMGM